MAEVLAGVGLGQEVGVAEIVTLFSARGPEVRVVAEVADDLRRRIAGDAVTFVYNRNINYTNVCTFKCRFCAFSKGPLSLNLRGAPYLLELDEITTGWPRQRRRARPRSACRAASTRTSTGTITSTCSRRCARRRRHPHPRLHRAGSDRGGAPLGGAAGRVPDPPARRRPQDVAGHGGGDPRRRGARRAVPGQDLDGRVARGAPHGAPGRAALERHDHVRLGRATASAGPGTSWRPGRCSRETGGFTEFVPLPFVHMATPIYLQRRARRGPTFREALLMHAVGRIAYAGDIDNIQVSWVKMGAEGARQVLQAGVNDLGGTLIDENISRAAGASPRAAHGGRGPRGDRDAAGPAPGAAFDALRAGRGLCRARDRGGRPGGRARAQGGLRRPLRRPGSSRPPRRASCRR